MKPIKTIGELRKEYRGVRSGVAGDTIFMAKAMMFLIENPPFLSKKRKRKASDWSIFLGSYLREGKTIQEAAKDWKEEKKKLKR